MCSFVLTDIPDHILRHCRGLAGQGVPQPGPDLVALPLEVPRVAVPQARDADEPAGEAEFAAQHVVRHLASAIAAFLVAGYE